jgi:hypothetical protein
MKIRYEIEDKTIYAGKISFKKIKNDPKQTKNARKRT